MKRLTLLCVTCWCTLSGASGSILEARRLASVSIPAAAVAAKPLPWPNRSPVRFQLSEVSDWWDGQPLVYLRFRAAGIDLRVRQSDFADWAVMPDARGGVNFSHRWDASARGALTWFPAGSFLRRLDSGEWNRHLASLVPRSGELRLLANDDSRLNRAMLQVLGARTRVLSYVLRSGSTDEPLRRRLQVFVEHRGGDSGL